MSGQFFNKTDSVSNSRNDYYEYNESNFNDSNKFSAIIHSASDMQMTTGRSDNSKVSGLKSLSASK